MIYLLINLAMASPSVWEYKDTNKVRFTIQASSYKEASKKCFDRLTGGKYPGESRGLDIIDVCSNPIKGEIK